MDKRRDDTAAKQPQRLAPYSIVVYSLEHLNHVRKTQFGYALRGRDGISGTIAELRGRMMGRNCLRVPTPAFGKLKAFLDFWKVQYKKEEAYFVDNQQRK